MSVPRQRRFEVFKRDSFTCQYCGAKAPDVVLHADHIHPKAEGGTDDIVNLITACEGCNLGKGKRKLSDDSAIVKQRTQLEQLQERQDQLAMMMEWQRSLLNQDESAVLGLEELWSDVAYPSTLTETGRQTLRKLLRKYGYEAVATAIRISADQYITYGPDGEHDHASVAGAFKKLSGICRVRASEADKPWLKELYYVRAILRNRENDGLLSYVNLGEAQDILETAFAAGADFDHLKKLARDASSWTRWKNWMDEYTAWLEKGGG